MAIENAILLLGKKLSHSFSKLYFDKIFAQQSYKDWSYNIFELQHIDEFLSLKNQQYLGFNVTIPYKTAIIPYLDNCSNEARCIGAVNTIKRISINHKNLFYGYNTDAPAFDLTIKPLLHRVHKALIIGNGGVAKAVQFVLEKNNIVYQTIARNTQLSLENFNNDLLKTHQLIINCTPVGMYPNQNECINFPFHLLNSKHILYDMVYNPSKTLFLASGDKQGCTTINGLKMLYTQAELALKIWENKLI